MTCNDKWRWEGQGAFVMHRECLGHGVQSARRRRRAEHKAAVTQCKVLPHTKPFPPSSTHGRSQGGSKDLTLGTLHFSHVNSSVVAQALGTGAWAAPHRAAAPG